MTWSYKIYDNGGVVLYKNNTIYQGVAPNIDNNYYHENINNSLNFINDQIKKKINDNNFINLASRIISELEDKLNN